MGLWRRRTTGPVIRVQLLAASHRHGHELLATLKVDADGSHRVTGSSGVVDLTQVMLHFPGPRLVAFRDEPIAWARCLPHNLTSPALFAVVVVEHVNTPRPR